MIGGPTVELDDTVRGDIWDLMKFVRRDFLEEFRLDPNDCIGRTQRGLHVRESHLVFGKIVGARSRRDAFVARHAEAVEIDCPIRKAQFRRRVLERHVPKIRPTQLDVSVARPCLRIMRRSTN